MFTINEEIGPATWHHQIPEIVRKAGRQSWELCEWLTLIYNVFSIDVLLLIDEIWLQ